MSARFRSRAALAAALTVVPAALAVPAAQADVPQLLEQDTWLAGQPLPGAGIFTPPIVEGGWSAFAPIDDHHYWTISDRGPNGQPSVSDPVAPGTRRTFLAPAFTPTIYKVAVGDDGTLSVQARIRLHLKPGATDPAQAYLAAHPDAAKAIAGGPANQITGLPQIATAAQASAGGLPADAGTYKRSAAQDEVPYAADGVTTLPSDPYGLDTEGIAVDPRDHSFWLGDEYRPSLVHVAADGTLLSRIVPAGVTVAADGADAAKFPAADPAVLPTAGLLPRAFAYRKPNRGMEGATLTPDGTALFGMLQSSIEPPAGKGDARTLRLVRFDVRDPAHPALTGEFAYRLDTPRAGTGLKQTDISVSDIFAIDGRHLLVDEHDNVTDVAGAGQKVVFAIDLSHATNLAGDAAANGEDPRLEAGNAAGVTPVAKTQVLDLGPFGYDHDKPEGIGVFPDGDLAVQDDNDFGFAQGDDPQQAPAGDAPFRVTASGHTTQLWRFGGVDLPAADGPAGGDDDGTGGGDGDGGDWPGWPDGGDWPPAGDGGGLGGQGAATHRPKVRFVTHAASRAKVLAGGAVTLKVRISLATTATTTITARVGRRTVTLGKATQKLAAGPVTIRVPLSAAGRRLVRANHHRLALSVAVKATASGRRTTRSTAKLSVR